MSRYLFSFVCNGSKPLTSRALLVPRYFRSMSSGFSSSNLDLTFQDDGTALVNMKSGDNRFTPEAIDDWHLVFDQIEKTPECRALVTTGQGKFFSNGLDLEYVKSFAHYKRQFSEYLDKFNRVIMRLLVFPVPTIAAINGHAFAGGALWALAHDVRVMREDKGWVCLNEVLFDGRFTPFLMEMMKAKLTSTQARTQAIMFAKRFTSAEALQYGIVDKITDQSQLVDVSKELANQILGKDGISRDNLNLFKKDIYQNVLMARQMPEEMLKNLIMK